MVEVGTIKTVKNKGLKFDLQAIDEKFIPMDSENHDVKRLGIVISEVPENKYGIKKGMKMVMAD